MGVVFFFCFDLFLVVLREQEIVGTNLKITENKHQKNSRINFVCMVPTSKVPKTKFQLENK